MYIVSLGEMNQTYQNEDVTYESSWASRKKEISRLLISSEQLEEACTYESQGRKE